MNLLSLLAQVDGEGRGRSLLLLHTTASAITILSLVSYSIISAFILQLYQRVFVDCNPWKRYDLYVE